MEKIYILALATLAIDLASGYHRADLPPGPYCGLGGKRGGCCRGREDKCAHIILDTVCYCDQFCMENRAHDDCCPDYEEVCLGLELPPPETQKEAICILGVTKTQGCKKCICSMVNDQPDWACAEEDCINSEDVVRGVNSGGQQWRATTYDQFAEINLKDGLVYKLGTLPLRKETLKMGSIHYDDDIVYPEAFDARVKFGSFISPIQDQRYCGSDWALTIASITADRFAIATNGVESVPMSAQSLLSCNIDRWGRHINDTNNCEGGHIDYAWNYVKRHGIVDAICFPYKGKVTACPYDVLNDDLKSAGCSAQVKSRTERYTVSVPYRLSTEQDIMYDIMKSGPVHAIMKVYQDFFHYRDGVYHHTKYGNQRLSGWHSVKIIGWGSDRGSKYWIVANTWGKKWGENGYFRIERGSNESAIETFIVAATSLISVNQDQRI